eukprot:8432709-Heterocapsa_arctica.AAC.1
MGTLTASMAEKLRECSRIPHPVGLAPSGQGAEERLRNIIRECMPVLIIDAPCQVKAGSGLNVDGERPVHIRGVGGQDPRCYQQAERS